MIEQAMMFALGFAFCGLLALALLPAFWRRAMRLSARRVHMQVPLSMDEILAERDLLRAEFAVTQRRLEQRLEALIERQAQDMRALGFSQSELALRQQQYEETVSQLAERDQHLSQALDRLETVSKELAETAIARDQHQAQVRDQSLQISAMERAYQNLSDIAEERRALIASLETRLSGLEMKLSDATERLVQLQLAGVAEQTGVAEQAIVAEQAGVVEDEDLSLEDPRHSHAKAHLPSAANLSMRDHPALGAQAHENQSAQKAPN